MIDTEEIEQFRDRLWRREESLKVETAAELEQFVSELGFCLALTDCRTPLPSAYIAVCGRRDAHAPKNVQKDFEMSLAWTLKDEAMRRGKVYYAKMIKGRAMFVAPRLIPYFNAVYGIGRVEEKAVLSENANKVLRVLRTEWEMATIDLKSETGIPDRKDLTKAIDELQKKMKVVPSEVLYEPRFTYIWTLPEGRFPMEMSQKVTREDALVELARAFLSIRGITKRGEFAGAFSLKRAEAGRANHRLVDEGFAERIETGVYVLKSLNTEPNR